MTKRLRLPPKLDRYAANGSPLGGPWEDYTPTYRTKAAAIRESRAYPKYWAVVVRRLSDGAIVWRNRAAREAGL